MGVVCNNISAPSLVMTKTEVEFLKPELETRLCVVLSPVHGGGQTRCFHFLFHFSACFLFSRSRPYDVKNVLASWLSNSVDFI